MYPKTSFIVFFCSLIFLSSCGNIDKDVSENSFEINYLDEYVIYNDTIFRNSKIGGLSDIEYIQEKNQYYIVCDDTKNNRYYKASIRIENKLIDTVSIDKQILLKDKNNQFLSTNILDLEAIRSFGKNQLILTSEGSIENDYNPAIFITDSNGNYQNQLTLPSYFLLDTSSKNQPRHNGVFEGLAKDTEKEGYWAAMELPLELDGEEPSYQKPGAPVRITHFNSSTGEADYQFTYPLDKLAKNPKEKFAINGVTTLLQLSEKQFLIVERGYVDGYGTQGNTVRIYLCTIAEATNTLYIDSLMSKDYQAATKHLLFDFESVRDQLTNQIIDNIEGITFGPILANGNQSLLLISDNNFNPVSKQINQLILLELSKKPSL